MKTTLSKTLRFVLAVITGIDAKNDLAGLGRRLRYEDISSWSLCGGCIRHCPGERSTRYATISNLQASAPSISDVDSSLHVATDSKSARRISGLGGHKACHFLSL